MNKIDLIKETLSTAWPAVLESFFISLAGMIDTMMVATRVFDTYLQGQL